MHETHDIRCPPLLQARRTIVRDNPSLFVSRHSFPHLSHEVLAQQPEGLFRLDQLPRPSLGDLLRDSGHHECFYLFGNGRGEEKG